MVEAVLARATFTQQEERSRAAPRRILVFSDRPVIGGGLVGLLPEHWREDAARHAEPGSFADALGDAASLAVIDNGAAGAVVCADLAVAGAVPYLLLLDRRDSRVRPVMLRAAGAVLLTAELSAETLALTISAAAHGLHVFPKGLVPLPAGATGAPRPSADRMDTALMLLASGCRDAEIAATLNLSEGAARKLVQRAVGRLRARTRCQAVAVALDRGELQ